MLIKKDVVKLRLLEYCTKCGTVNPSEKVCIICGASDRAVVPEKYISYIANTIPILNESLKDEFINEVVKKNPNFDQNANNRLTEIHEQRKRQDKILKSEMEELKHIPKCPTCGSVNIHKISAVESGASIWAFGLFSRKINKTFKCNNCGYTW